MEPAIQRLAESAALDAQMAEQFERYTAMLLEARKFRNLTAYDSCDSVVDGLLLDALAGREILSRWGGTVIDVGTGAGIPGLPLAMMDARRPFVLMDSGRKKTEFVQSVVDALGLSNVTVHTARIEEVGHASEHREQYGVALAKAVAELRVLVEWLVPLVSSGGRVICWKGRAVHAEIEAARSALHKLGAEVEEVIGYTVPNSDERYLVVLRRSGPLPSHLPRRVGLAQKRPL